MHANGIVHRDLRPSNIYIDYPSNTNKYENDEMHTFLVGHKTIHKIQSPSQQHININIDIK